MRLRPLGVCSVSLLCGCSTPPADQEGAPSDYMPPPVTVWGSGGVPSTMPSALPESGGVANGTPFPAGAPNGGGGAFTILSAGGAPSGGGTPAIGAGGASATGGAPNGGVGGVYVPPPGALPDVTFSMQSTIAPGGESLMCVYVAMPADRGVIAVPSAESEFTPGSHHLLAYRTALTAIPAGAATTPTPCADGPSVSQIRGSYYEAQSPKSRRDLPPGVAHRFQPGEVVILQTHYLNPSTTPLEAHAVLTMHTVEVATVPQEAGTIMFTDYNISVPAGGTARSTMTCTLPTDFNPALLWSHMHKQGVNFIATTDDRAAAATLGTLYQESDWSEPHPRAYPFNPPATLHAGTHITFSCDFKNPTSATLTFGQSAEKNEMCILHGMYWPRMTSSGEQCSGGTTTRGPIPATP